MKRFSIPTLVLMVVSIISACGARDIQPTPTLSAVDLQGTIAAAAWTVIAQTQAAIPTSTPVPTSTITNTPAPTNTFIPLPTDGPSPTPRPGEGDPCATTLLPATLEGTTIKIRIDNPTRATINVTVYLQQARPQGVCGYRAYSLAAGQSLVINDLVEGCYTIWAWNPDPNDYFMVTNGTSCLNSSRPWAFDISKSSIRLKE